MTPQHAQWALCAFLLVAAAVAVNAVFMQTRPTLATRAVIERPLPVAERPTKVPEAARTRARPSEAESIRRTPEVRQAPAKAVPAAESPETVRAIQRELRERGYGPLVSDGIPRAVMRAAIMAFEHDHGLPLTGEATGGLLKRIVFGVSADGDPAPGAARSVATPRAAEIVRTAQEQLARAGYLQGAPDGRLGEETQRAIRAFERDMGLDAKGRISAELLIGLSEAPPATTSSTR